MNEIKQWSIYSIVILVILTVPLNKYIVNDFIEGIFSRRTHEGYGLNGLVTISVLVVYPLLVSAFYGFEFSLKRSLAVVLAAVSFMVFCII